MPKISSASATFAETFNIDALKQAARELQMVHSVHERFVEALDALIQSEEDLPEAQMENGMERLREIKVILENGLIESVPERVCRFVGDDNMSNDKALSCLAKIVEDPVGFFARWRDADCDDKMNDTLYNKTMALLKERDGGLATMRKVVTITNRSLVRAAAGNNPVFDKDVAVEDETFVYVGDDATHKKEDSFEWMRYFGRQPAGEVIYEHLPPFLRKVGVSEECLNLVGAVAAASVTSDPVVSVATAPAPSADAAVADASVADAPVAVA